MRSAARSCRIADRSRRSRASARAVPCGVGAATLVLVAERRSNPREIHSYELEQGQVAAMAQILRTFAEIMSDPAT
jgi:hypothetical protein